jgi:hypothetical protein
MAQRWPILLCLAGMACPASATRPVTVVEFEQILEAARSKSDTKTAKELSAFELTERVSTARLAGWLGEFPGRRTRAELTELADASAFLDPPAIDISLVPAPDMATRQQFLAKAVHFAGEALSKLPNFYATRLTTHYEDQPPDQTLADQTLEQSRAGSSRSFSRAMDAENITVNHADYAPLHKTGTYEVMVSYRDGGEITDHDPTSKKPKAGAIGLTTRGEFGPILYVIFRDSAAGSLDWERWEKGPDGPLAVFRYSVPQAHSHYLVQLPSPLGSIDICPAYHGEIALDSDSGTIMRLTVISDMAAPYQTVIASMLVEYGPVEIGDRTYVCPLRGIALSKIPVRGADSHGALAPLQTELNDVSFRDYHLFRGDTRILTDDGAGALVRPPASQ